MENSYNVNQQLVEEQFNKAEESRHQQKSKIVFDAKNYLNLRLNKGEVSRQVQIRILPNSPTDSRIAIELHTHSLKVSPEIAQSGFKSFICLNDENLKSRQDCPLCRKSNELLERARQCKDPIENKALFKAAMSYKPKLTYVVRVIERGKEDEGVKFWRFNAHNDGNGIWDKLITLYRLRNEESIQATGKTYNLFDLYHGKDIVINLTADPNTGRTTPHLSDAGFPTPLSKDKKQIEEWVCDEKEWSDMYAFKAEDYLQLIADGEVPYYDKTSGKWVAKKQMENNSENTISAANEALTVAPQTETASPSEEDLPF